MESPQLPAAYEVTQLDGKSVVLDHTVELAKQGSPEGTLVWATSQPQGSHRLEKPWFSPDNGLYLALILEPEFEPSRYGEIGLIGLLSLGWAVSDHVAPMTDLRYRWPNDLLLSGSKVGGVTLRKASDASWLVLGVSLNVASEPSEVIDGGCVVIEGGCAEIQPTDILESFAREFLHWINRWDEDGLSTVLSALKGRWGKVGESALIDLAPGESVAGEFQEAREDGALILRTPDGSKTICLNEFFGL
ncbi:MAG: biotin--[acetyl-CoA-carboxylase] ligase [Wenzhouxiangella sp.]|jgi:BirA family biotin operon repressor/biotin-[acetyl-CoA-carboxylase] ligase|nr:biotin--[acetyl-CoA-carboxylase] ligase [Wenzhouxiangella sp.]